ncbi:MAG TPA: molybdopterin-binding/glycosyltransferase family 2 protein [Mesorhizobium sp.]|jgi:molybdenum cofactor cytidylyltransferase|nr:molybdopterin-binding/glycosyltransferase family 2 protein [Mesorhizobium sp.]
MRFGPIPLDQAEGAVLAHAVQAGAARLRKGHRLTRGDIAALGQAGVAEVIAAVLEPGDRGEDEAATRLAGALRFGGAEARRATTGRVNIHAVHAGLFTVDKGLIDRINAVDPAVTLATLAPFAATAAGQMVATVKIIPFAVPGAMLQRAAALAGEGEAFAVHAFRPLRAGLVQTVLPGVKASVLDKTVRATEDRLKRSGGSVGAERRTSHDAGEVAGAIRALLPQIDILLLFGASAVSDPADVLPDAIRLAGGKVFRVGMPVDPGNLLVLGEVAGKPVIGAPGCARSPKENGFDWVLDRLAAGLEVSDEAIAGMGVGGLLMEIPARPQPREAPAVSNKAVSAVVLAAGRSSRMGGPNKLLALFEGEPLVRLVAGQALRSGAAEVVVVTGHQAERVEAALAGFSARLVHNPDFRAGLASSLKTGVSALSDEAAGALVMLGDMPGVSAGDLDRMIAAFRRERGGRVVRATSRGKRGNPVILPRALFSAVMALEGDTGARHIVESADAVDVDLGDHASLDVDTPEAMAAAGGLLQD